MENDCSCLHSGHARKQRRKEYKASGESNRSRFLRESLFALFNEVSGGLPPLSTADSTQIATGLTRAAFVVCRLRPYVSCVTKSTGTAREGDLWRPSSKIAPVPLGHAGGRSRSLAMEPITSSKAQQAAHPLTRDPRPDATRRCLHAC